MTIVEHCPLPTQVRCVVLEKINLCHLKQREFDGCLLQQHNPAYPDHTLKLSIMMALTLEAQAVKVRRAVGDA